MKKMLCTIRINSFCPNSYLYLLFQVLKYLHKKLRNVSKKSELSKKKVGVLCIFSFCVWSFSVLITCTCSSCGDALWYGAGERSVCTVGETGCRRVYSLLHSPEYQYKPIYLITRCLRVSLYLFLFHLMRLYDPSLSSCSCSSTDFFIWSRDVIWPVFISSVSCCTDGSDGPGGGGGLLSVLAAPPHRAHVGGVRLLPPEPGVLRVPDGGPLPGLQQLLRQPHHLRLPVGELQELLQAGVPVPGPRRVSPERPQGPPQPDGAGPVHQRERGFQRSRLSDRKNALMASPTRLRAAPVVYRESDWFLWGWFTPELVPTGAGSHRSWFPPELVPTGASTDCSQLNKETKSESLNLHLGFCVCCSLLLESVSVVHSCWSLCLWEKQSEGLKQSIQLFFNFKTTA